MYNFYMIVHFSGSHSRHPQPP